PPLSIFQSLGVLPLDHRYADAKTAIVDLKIFTFARMPTARPATSAVARAATARLCLLARRRIADPPLPALRGLFVVISKRDPAPSFNRIIHIDS
ncbi:MAG: hypothetical protein WCF66_08975, partial [Pseudolabrys sp.]